MNGVKYNVYLEQTKSKIQQHKICKDAMHGCAMHGVLAMPASTHTSLEDLMSHFSSLLPDKRVFSGKFPAGCNA